MSQIMKIERISTFVVIFLVIVLRIHIIHADVTKSCTDCHPLSKFKGSNSHQPLNNCLNCHTAHVSKYSDLLIDKIPNLCYNCHPKILKDQKKFKEIHYPLRKGNCLICHNAHRGEKNLLKFKEIKKICLNCHKIRTKYRYLHNPFKKGNCTLCHLAHYFNNTYLLKDKNICLKCHSLSTLTSTHLYLKKGKDCLSCHNPHGSNRAKLLKLIAHKPYKEGRCKECHSKNIKGNEMCFKCHKDVEKDFEKIYNHYLPEFQGKPFCIYCHSPHLSNQKYLLKAQVKTVCLNCHREVIIQKANSIYVHKNWDRCLICHTGHGSNVRSMLKEKVMKLCGRCHKSHVKFTHPIGENVRDPRNGQATSCITCHDPMGTDYKYLLRLSGDKELCVECHKGY